MPEGPSLVHLFFTYTFTLSILLIQSPHDLYTTTESTPNAVLPILRSKSLELLAEVEVVVPPELRQELVLGDVVLDLLRVGEEDEPALFMAGVEDLGN